MKIKNKSPDVTSIMETRSVHRHRHRRMPSQKRNQKVSKIKKFQNH